VYDNDLKVLDEASNIQQNKNLEGWYATVVEISFFFGYQFFTRYFIHPAENLPIATVGVPVGPISKMQNAHRPRG
jgi:hypothetical protein